jgi:hypothetical protein
VGTVVWRRRRSWGRTQTDSRIVEKIQKSCWIIRQTIPNDRSGRYIQEGDGGVAGKLEEGDGLTSLNPHPGFPSFFLKINITIGAKTALPTKLAAPNFHAFSLSRVLAYTRIIRSKMYKELRM